MAQCPDCHSIRIFSIPPAGDGLCSRCDGTGKRLLSGLNEAIMGVPLDCEDCNGTGDCQTCGGTGIVDDIETETDHSPWGSGKSDKLPNEPSSVFEQSGSTNYNTNDTDDDSDSSDDDYSGTYYGGGSQSGYSGDSFKVWNDKGRSIADEPVVGKIPTQQTEQQPVQARLEKWPFIVIFCIGISLMLIILVVNRDSRNSPRPTTNPKLYDIMPGYEAGRVVSMLLAQNRKDVLDEMTLLIQRLNRGEDISANEEAFLRKLRLDADQYYKKSSSPTVSRPSLSSGPAIVALAKKELQANGFGHLTVQETSKGFLSISGRVNSRSESDRVKKIALGISGVDRVSTLNLTYPALFGTTIPSSPLPITNEKSKPALSNKFRNPAVQKRGNTVVASLKNYQNPQFMSVAQKLEFALSEAGFSKLSVVKGPHGTLRVIGLENYPGSKDKIKRIISKNLQTR